MTRRETPRLMLAIGLLLALVTLPSWADVPLELRGEFRQGALVTGRTVPGAAVEFAGDPVRVSDDGQFLIGFHRDEPETRTLRIELPGGERREEVLVIEQRDYQVQRIDGLPDSQVTPPEDAHDRIRRDIRIVRNARARDEPRTDFLTDFIQPVEGRLTGVYGSQRVLNGEPRQPHYGIDIAAPVGTPIRAPAPGVVTVAEGDMYFSGGTMILDHGHGLSTSYLHMSAFHADVGDRVEQGEIIGEVGATGRVTGPHLCWRASLFDRRLDPGLLVDGMREGDRARD